MPCRHVQCDCVHELATLARVWFVLWFAYYTSDNWSLHKPPATDALVQCGVDLEECVLVKFLFFLRKWCNNTGAVHFIEYIPTDHSTSFMCTVLCCIIILYM